MKELKKLMEHEEDLISYGYDKELCVYNHEYYSTNYNDFLFKLINHLINDIIQRKVSLKNIKPKLDEIKKRMEKYKQIEKKSKEG